MSNGFQSRLYTFSMCEFLGQPQHGAPGRVWTTAEKIFDNPSSALEFGGSDGVTLVNSLNWQATCLEK